MFNIKKCIWVISHWEEATSCNKSVPVCKKNPTNQQVLKQIVATVVFGISAHTGLYACAGTFAPYIICLTKFFTRLRALSCLGITKVLNTKVFLQCIVFLCLQILYTLRCYECFLLSLRKAMLSLFFSCPGICFTKYIFI